MGKFLYTGGTKKRWTQRRHQSGVLWDGHITKIFRGLQARLRWDLYMYQLSVIGCQIEVNYRFKVLSGYLVFFIRSALADVVARA